MSQSKPDKTIGVHVCDWGVNEAKPFMKVATKIAQSLDISLDFVMITRNFELNTDVTKKIQISISDQIKTAIIFSMLWTMSRKM